MKFRAQFQQMADSEIRAMIPPYFLEDVKRRDPKPLFKAFIVGQEGEAEGSWVGVGKVVKTWFADAIGKLSRKIWAGMKLFSGHAETNEHEGRTQIGEVAGSRAKTIDGKFSAMIAAYIFPEYKNMPFDVASIEADININDNISGDVHAVDVDEITGIALGNSTVDKPGFPGATLLGELQAFANGRLQSNKEGENMPSLEEIKKFVTEEGIDPSEVFGRDSLIDDPTVKGIVAAEVKRETTGEYVSRKRDAEGFDKTRTKLEKEKKVLEDENKKLKTDGAKIKAADLFSTKAKERKLDDKQIKFIEAKKDDFAPEDLDNTDKEVDKFMDNMLEEFKSTAEIFGHKTEKEAGSKGGGEPGEGGSSEENELIPD